MAHTVLFRGAISVYSFRHFQHTRAQRVISICHLSLIIFHLSLKSSGDPRDAGRTWVAPGETRGPFRPVVIRGDPQSGSNMIECEWVWVVPKPKAGCRWRVIISLEFQTTFDPPCGSRPGDGRRHPPSGSPSSPQRYSVRSQKDFSA